MSTVRRYTPAYTVADYAEWPGDWELWNGLAVAMTPSPFGPHQLMISRLIVALAKELDTHHCGRTFKRYLYQQRSVLFYQLIDPDAKLLEAYRLSDTEYEAILYEEQLQLEMHAACSVNLKIAALFET